MSGTYAGLEIETQVALAERLGYGRKEEYAAVHREAAKIGRMINGLIRAVRPSSAA